jgi:hypothetical protein
MDIVGFLKANKPFVFAKFGDGEYFASVGAPGGNCDGTQYTPELGKAVREAFQRLGPLPNTYLGKWVDTPYVAPYFETLSSKVCWENYNIFIFRTKDEYFQRCLPIYRAIKQVPRQKIYIGNSSMQEGINDFLGPIEFLDVHPVNWFEQFEATVNRLLDMVKTADPLILVSAGMGAKPLIALVATRLPDATILDLGSALDLVCGWRRSRNYHRLTNAEIAEIRASLTTAS